MARVGGIAGEQLRSFVERVERLHEERKALSDDIRDVYAEAKATGFDVPTIKAVIKIRATDKDDLDEKEALLETYLRALGMRGSETGTDRATRARAPDAAAPAETEA